VQWTLLPVRVLQTAHDLVAAVSVLLTAAQILYDAGSEVLGLLEQLLNDATVLVGDAMVL
jgi:hypothetical protein